MTPPWRGICTVLFSRPSCAILWTTSFPLKHPPLHLSAEGSLLLVCGRFQVSLCHNIFLFCLQSLFKLQVAAFKASRLAHPSNPQGVYRVQCESKNSQGRPTKIDHEQHCDAAPTPTPSRSRSLMRTCDAPM